MLFCMLFNNKKMFKNLKLYPTLIFFLLLIAFFTPLQAKSEPINVTYAGFSFSSNYIDIETTGKYTNLLLKEKNENGMDIISVSLLKEIKKARVLF